VAIPTGQQVAIVSGHFLKKDGGYVVMFSRGGMKDRSIEYPREALDAASRERVSSAGVEFAER
jgi:hypothetical protein